MGSSGSNPTIKDQDLEASWMQIWVDDTDMNITLEMWSIVWMHSRGWDEPGTRRTLPAGPGRAQGRCGLGYPLGLND